MLKLLFKVFIALVSINKIYAEVCDPGSKPKTQSMKIKDKILCNYDKDTHPKYKGQNQTRVELFISPITIEFIELKATIRVQVWAELFWRDEKFQWNAEDYDNTSVILVDPYSLWIPDLSLVNWKENTVQLDKICTNVLVGNEGWLYTSTMSVLTGHCTPDWNNWPFDIQNCEIHMTSRQYMGHEVDFDLAAYEGFSKGLYMEDFIPSREWELISYKGDRIVTPYGNFSGTIIFRVDIKIFLSIRRHASVLVSSYVMPGFVMMLLSLTVFWFDPFTNHRIPIICVLVFLQSFILQFFSYKIPSNGPQTPKIVLFYGGSLILTSQLLVLTLLTRSMATWRYRSAHLHRLLEFLRGNQIVQYLLITNVKTYYIFKDENNDAKTKDDGDWQELSHVLNRIAFTVISPIYFVFFAYYVYY